MDRNSDGSPESLADTVSVTQSGRVTVPITDPLMTRAVVAAAKRWQAEQAEDALQPK